jgi:hypothetical protein
MKRREFASGTASLVSMTNRSAAAARASFRNPMTMAIGSMAHDTRRTADSPGTAFLPSYSFHERHDSTPLHASPAAIIDAVERLDMRADPVIRTLLDLRALPARLFGRATAPDDRATAREADSFGFSTFTPLRRTSHELSLGLTGRFWRLGANVVAVPDAQAFMRFDQPGHARLVLRFLVVERADGARILRTETFVHCPDCRTRARMTPYWWIVRGPSGWIRRRTLRAVHTMLSTHA